MSITISEAVELTPMDANLVRRWGGSRQLSFKTREVVLVGRLQRVLLDVAKVETEAANMRVVDGRMGPLTKRVFDAYNAAHPGDPIALGPELTPIVDAVVVAPDAEPTGDLPEDPHEEVTADHRADAPEDPGSASPLGQGARPMKLLWLDCETSGLDPLKNQILELSVGVADLSTPFEVESMARFVLRFVDSHTHGMGCREPGGVLTSLFTNDGPCPSCEFAPQARAMHAETGLTVACASSTVTMGEVEDHLLTLVHGQPDRGDDKPTLAGSTVHFDLGFLRAHAPRFAARISHRCYDVSAVKLFCESLGMPRIPKANAHCATNDVLESIEHARRCVDWLRRHDFSRVPESQDARAPCTLDNCGHMRQLDEIVDLLGMERGVRSVLDELRSREGERES